MIAVSSPADILRDYRTATSVYRQSVKHTPGPWSYLEEGREEEEFNAGRELTISGSNDDLAKILSCDDSTVDIPREEAIANAHLISAAPDLLAALHALINVIEFSPYSPINFYACTDRENPTLTKARAAIVKARAHAVTRAIALAERGPTS